MPRPLPFLLQLFQQELGGDAAELHAALKGLELYQLAPRTDPWVSPPVATRQGRVKLLDYGGPADGPCLLFVPSLINGPHILDIDTERSMLRWFAAQGFAPYLVDWGKVTTDARDEDIDHHIAQYLVPLIASLERPVHLIGYCLGGTMALAAASLAPVASLALIASPWHFDQLEAARSDEILRLWRDNRAQAEHWGMLPMEVLQTGFWALDPARVAAKFAALNQHDMDTRHVRQFVTTEDWANSGEPLPLNAARQLFDDLYERNISGRDQWRIGGCAVGPAAVNAPSLSIRSRADQIVPAATSPHLDTIWDLDTGHVGMVIGSRRHAQLWEPLAEWIRQQDARRTIS